MAHLGLPVLGGVFIVSAGAIWFAGIQLSKTTDEIELISLIRGSVTNQPKALWDLSAELAHGFGSGAGIRTLNLAVNSRLLYR